MSSSSKPVWVSKEVPPRFTAPESFEKLSVFRRLSHKFLFPASFGWVSYLATVAQELPVSSLALYLANEVKVQPEQMIVYYSATYIPWAWLKPLFGAFSDRVPICGLRRRPYLVLGALGVAAMYALMAFIARSFNALLIMGVCLSCCFVILQASLDARSIEIGRELGRGLKSSSSPKAPRSAPSAIANPHPHPNPNPNPVQWKGEEGGLERPLLYPQGEGGGGGGGGESFIHEMSGTAIRLKQPLQQQNDEDDDNDVDVKVEIDGKPSNANANTNTNTDKQTVMILSQAGKMDVCVCVSSLESKQVPHGDDDDDDDVGSSNQPPHPQRHHHHHHRRSRSQSHPSSSSPDVQGGSTLKQQQQQYNSNGHNDHNHHHNHQDEQEENHSSTSPLLLPGKPSEEEEEEEEAKTPTSKPTSVLAQVQAGAMLVRTCGSVSASLIALAALTHFSPHLMLAWAGGAAVLTAVAALFVPERPRAREEEEKGENQQETGPVWEIFWPRITLFLHTLRPLGVSLLVIMLCDAVPDTTDVYPLYLATQFQFEPWQYQLRTFLGLASSALGTMLYWRYFSHRSLFLGMVFGRLVASGTTFMQLIMTTGAYKHLGVGWYWVTVGEACISSTTSSLALMPTIVLTAKLSVKGSEGTSFGALSALTHVSYLISSAISLALTKVFGLTNDNWAGLSKFVIVCGFCQIFPILFFPLLRPVIRLAQSKDPF